MTACTSSTWLSSRTSAQIWASVPLRWRIWACWMCEPLLERVHFEGAAEGEAAPFGFGVIRALVGDAVAVAVGALVVEITVAIFVHRAAALLQ